MPSPTDAATAWVQAALGTVESLTFSTLAGGWSSDVYAVRARDGGDAVLRQLTREPWQTHAAELPVDARASGPPVGAAQTARVRFIVRVSPGSRRPGVGGRYGAAEPPVLVVRVGAPAADGKANQAVVRALAEALHVPVARVRIIRGQSSRTKVVQVDDGDVALLEGLLKTRDA